MKTVIGLLALGACACAAWFLLRASPQERACVRLAELCGLGKPEAQRCVRTLDSVGGPNVAVAAQAMTCVAEAKSCGEAMGCASGAAVTAGASFVKDFLTGLRKTAN